ncbi:putative alpha-1,3-glucan synthase [Talaromyces proteolyticus]|uniref:alpha-1,3-glucan synthase n=1 Tax=Talaromyces proteolyticus TaxID=1131652 RepID=A0AAD4L1P8_9EURO|nr:putative alpha-1,3-glucan synthase [Talaromyces proteolyticus]KAH8702491.1 putative alpha-1,3-glucan synthase [Talaromyces proteolyticus]
MKRSSQLLKWTWLFYGLHLNTALPYTPSQILFNLNENQTATSPLDYWGQWRDHEFQPSPDNWRMPFYTVFLDRFVNGDPSNDDANGTQWEHDILSNQFRNGGDVLGLVDSFDYLQGMGIKALYLAGMPHINQPWAADGYSPLDLTLLDHHFGTINDWRTMISEAHRRGIYVILENTIMGDLIGFEGFENTSAPLNPWEYNYIWKTSRRYHDFQPSNEWLEECEWEYPRFWDDYGRGLIETTLVKGCRNSEFDQYGEVASFGNYDEWERQITKFAYVQDRLREWRPDVLQKLKLFSCITIAMLDIDGFRIDKAIQVTLDAQADWSDSIRQCARRFNKTNFYIPGEIVSGNSFGALYVGRGQQINQTNNNMTEVVAITNSSAPDLHIRSAEKVALDSAAFHYSLYRSLTRFLGMDGTFEAEGDPPTNFVDLWNGLVQTNDMVNTNIRKFDPRHLYGVSNQDVFRWPSIQNGTEKEVLGLYIVSLLMPGSPILFWGEEQAFYVLDNTNANYGKLYTHLLKLKAHLLKVFGRPPMTSSLAWQLHGCYKVGSVRYNNFPIDSALYGCMDDNVSLDHRDPTAPIRGILKGMFEMRQNYPVLNDGYYLQQLSNMTYNIYLPGSNGTCTETGLWSVLRSRFEDTQDFTGIRQGNQSIWLVYQNDNRTINYKFNCSDHHRALVSPFDEGTTVKNLFPPFEEYTLGSSTHKLGLEGSDKLNGCLNNLTLPAWGFKAFVPKEAFIAPSSYITKFSPGHDARILSTVKTGETISISFQFSEEMDCNSITDGLWISSTTLYNQSAQLDKGSVSCRPVLEDQMLSWQGAFTGMFNYTIELTNVFHGVHEVVLKNVTNKGRNRTTNAVDHFLFRIGSADNPVVWPSKANYSRTLLYADSSDDGTLWVSHKAPGADKWRYTLDFGSSFSPWMPYTGLNVSIPPKNWSRAALQEWDGEHIMVQYWNRLTGSSSHYQHGDLNWNDKPPRRFPNFWLQGEFNQFGYDSGYRNKMHLSNLSGQWEFNFMAEWPTRVALNAWGMNDDGQPDNAQIYGDIDGDMILDRIPPISLLSNFINVTDPPPWPYLSWKLSLDDGNIRYWTTPQGSQKVQLAIYFCFAFVPLLSSATAVWVYLKAFYQVKFNDTGVKQQKHRPEDGLVRKSLTNIQSMEIKSIGADWVEKLIGPFSQTSTLANSAHDQALNADAGDLRRTVLFATMEYEIEDWGIKVKIGGLGVMAQLMSRNLGHLNLIWVVPCVGGIEYPIDRMAEPMSITVMGKTFQVQVQYHTIRNITYVLLDAPVFRAQSKSEPYPARMDDLNSAICYSAWNSCIAETLKRFPVDIYHINDYHGAAAQLHLLPETIPCCLSLHNAEFQGLWPMRTDKECQEVGQIFNLHPSIIKRYVQFGDVFNLLHAGAAYLHIHQNGFGAVGVSRKYGKRSWARYPIFWGLKEVGSLPNPDPSDTAEWKRGGEIERAEVNPEFEAARAGLKQKTQAWAGLEQISDAELFVFVGRWSMQKGIDLIADIFPCILENYPKTQLICVGPVIDLYGRFAAIKLNRIMQMFPKRVFSKPEFTVLPPYVFSGTEFALIPSRDEPFGLVAVEFGRKGALGVGSRVGGLGQMPGWWYTIESMTTKHLIHQFKQAIQEALNSKPAVRAIMRSRSGKQRFPVAQWVEELEILQSETIEKHHKYAKFQKLDRQSLIRNSLSRSLSKRLASEASTDNDESREGLKQTDARAEPGRQRPTYHRRKLSQSLSFLGNTAPQYSLDEEDAYCPTDEHSQSSDQPSESRRNGVLSIRDGSTCSSEVNSHNPSGVTTPIPAVSEHTISQPTLNDQLENSSSQDLLSIDNVIREKTSFNLQSVNPFFTDSTQVYAKKFQRKLNHLDGKNSEDQLCIEEYLSKSEKEWFNRYRDIKLGRSSSSHGTPTSSIFKVRVQSTADSDCTSPTAPASSEEEKNWADFELPRNYVPPSGLRRLLLYRIGDWSLYTMLLAFGQIIAANSYQVTLLNGEIGEPADKLYIIASIYLASSIVWWILFRWLKSIFVLSLPFLLYGSAFGFIGFSPLVSNSLGRWWMQNVATGLYAAASSSGSIFFALNFGDEGNSPVKSWVYRACVIQGTQQIYVTFLWYWGSRLAAHSQAGSAQISLADSNPKLLIGTGIGIAVFMWTLGTFLFLGLPDYYRQAPGKVPSFYKSLPRRKIILWFFYAVFVQNYWLSAPYGRNWLYLWSSKHAHTWEIIVLVLFFFIGIWAAILWVFSVLSKRHVWFVPIFAIGLGAPRWCQLLWSTSNIGAYVPWAGSPLASTLLGRGLWLWLGVLDALQGVGFGMILLNTLTRFHIAFTLIAAQVIGSVGTILARASAPDKLGPGDVFPDFSEGVHIALSKRDFWLCLLFILSINVLCFSFFRKEQLQKP